MQAAHTIEHSTGLQVTHLVRLALAAGLQGVEAIGAVRAVVAHKGDVHKRGQRTVLAVELYTGGVSSMIVHRGSEQHDCVMNCKQGEWAA